MQPFVPFQVTDAHNKDLIRGKWYLPTEWHDEFFGPYDSEDAAKKALPGIRVGFGTVCQTCED